MQIIIYFAVAAAVATVLRFIELFDHTN
jgi:hypothetical protein